MRQLEHEICTWTHFARKGFNVIFAELEGIGRFDLLVETPVGSVAVECKTIGEDTGDQLKSDLLVNLADIFERTAEQLLANAGLRPIHRDAQEGCRPLQKPAAQV